MRPTLLNSCAAAATAAEARYRIDARPGLQADRSTRVVALDAGAAEIVRPLAGQPWLGARFLYDAGDGLHDELADADFVLMIATNGDGAAAAAAIGDVCVLRGIMTAGLVLGPGGLAGSDGSEDSAAEAAGWDGAAVGVADSDGASAGVGDPDVASAGVGGAVGAAVAGGADVGAAVAGGADVGVGAAGGADVGAAVTALRPHSRVLLVSRDRRDAGGLLTALGA